MNDKQQDEYILNLFKFCDVYIHKINKTYIIKNLLKSNEDLYCYFDGFFIRLYGITNENKILKFKIHTVYRMIERNHELKINKNLERLGVVGIDNINF